MCRYGPPLEEMYTQMEQRQKERQNQMRDAAAQGSVLDKVKQVGSPYAMPLLHFLSARLAPFRLPRMK